MANIDVLQYDSLPEDSETLACAQRLYEGMKLIRNSMPTMDEAARALTPKKKPESIRELLDAPMKKWREECKPRY